MKLTNDDQKEIIKTDGYCIEYKVKVSRNRSITKRLYYLNGDIYSVEDTVYMLSKTFYDMDKIRYLVKNMDDIGSKSITVPSSFSIHKGF